MNSVFEKYNDKDDKCLGELIAKYTSKKCLAWLENKPKGEDITDYEWIMKCVKWSSKQTS